MLEGGSSHSGAAKIGPVAYALAGLATGTACCWSAWSIWQHLKHYRRPDLQRLSIRILLMVPIYAVASFISLSSKSASDYIDTARDIYEAFVVYAFFVLCINYLGGERELLSTLSQRLRVHHLWPFSLCFRPMNMSDPDTFLFVRRGVLQFILTKPLIALLTLLLKVTGNYQEGYIAGDSAYLWLSLLYNGSVCWSFYCLVLFYLQVREDLAPYRPLPKFLCVKSIIFVTFWQSGIVAIFVWLGWVHERGGYSTNNMALALSDLLLCLEMPLFAWAHSAAFPWTDYEDVRLSSRMVLQFALRDVVGVADIVRDSYDTFFRPHQAVSLDDVLGLPPPLWEEEDGIGAHGSGERNARRSGSRLTSRGTEADTGSITFPAPEDEEEMEQDYRQARDLLYGDFHFPVVREDPRYSHPPVVRDRIAQGAAAFRAYVAGDGGARPAERTSLLSTRAPPSRIPSPSPGDPSSLSSSGLHRTLGDGS